MNRRAAREIRAGIEGARFDLALPDMPRSVAWHPTWSNLSWQAYFRTIYRPRVQTLTIYAYTARLGHAAVQGVAEIRDNLGLRIGQIGSVHIDHVPDPTMVTLPGMDKQL